MIIKSTKYFVLGMVIEIPTIIAKPNPYLFGGGIS